mgnify:CR=1 FL=1
MSVDLRCVLAASRLAVWRRRSSNPPVELSGSILIKRILSKRAGTRAAAARPDVRRFNVSLPFRVCQCRNPPDQQVTEHLLRCAAQRRESRLSRHTNATA